MIRAGNGGITGNDVELDAAARQNGLTSRTRVRNVRNTMAARKSTMPKCAFCGRPARYGQGIRGRIVLSHCLLHEAAAHSLLSVFEAIRVGLGLKKHKSDWSEKKR